MKYQEIVYKQFMRDETTIIAYCPELAKVIGAKAAILMGQILFWWGMGEKPDFVYKTEEDLYQETGLTKSEQKGAIKKCKKLGILKVEYKGIPRKRHYRIIFDALEKLATSSVKSNAQVNGKTAHCIAENRPSITEISHERIQETTAGEVVRQKNKTEMEWLQARHAELINQLSFPK